MSDHIDSPASIRRRFLAAIETTVLDKMHAYVLYYIYTFRVESYSRARRIARSNQLHAINEAEYRLAFRFNVVDIFKEITKK